MPGTAGESAYLGPEITKVLAEDKRALHGDQTPAEWIKDNLFNSVFNSIITVVLGAGTVFLLVQGALWILDEEWAIIRVNLRNFMDGRFPNDELSRLWISAYILIGAVGIGAAHRDSAGAPAPRVLVDHRPAVGDNRFVSTEVDRPDISGEARKITDTVDPGRLCE